MGKNAENGPQGMVLLRSSAVSRAFGLVARTFYPESGLEEPAQGQAIHPSARIEAGVVLGHGVVIGPGAQIGEGTRIGAASRPMIVRDQAVVEAALPRFLWLPVGKEILARHSAVEQRNVVAVNPEVVVLSHDGQTQGNERTSANQQRAGAARGDCAKELQFIEVGPFHEMRVRANKWEGQRFCRRRSRRGLAAGESLPRRPAHRSV